MEIYPLEAEDYAAARSFVQPYERFCIPLMARLLAKKTPAFALLDSRGDWQAVFTFSPAGQLFHCLPLTKPGQREAFSAAFIRFFAGAAGENHAFFSINGEEHGTRLLSQALFQATAGGSSLTGKKAVEALRWQSYDFMRSPVSSGGEPLRAPAAGSGESLPACKIVRCTPSMTDLLFPLQTAYEKEEVVFNLASYSEEVSRLALRKSLREQAVYAVYDSQGKLVAKGGTNAQGLRFVQLGGVYTLPSQRGRGYAAALIRRIVADFAAQGKHCALFVKPENAAALGLYQKCGFTRYGVYRTEYFS